MVIRTPRQSRRQQKKQDMESLLLQIIGAAGASGSTITMIEAAAKYDRHTIVKYLLVLEQRGFISCRVIGKAKVWSLNTAPFQAIFEALQSPKSFLEQVLTAVISSIPQGLVVIDNQHKILYANSVAKKMNPSASTLYGLLQLPNPVRLTALGELLDGTRDVAQQQLMSSDNKWYTLNFQAFSRGEQRAVVVLVADITSQKNAQLTIAEQSALLVAERRALNKAAIVAETDLRGVITYVNDKFCKISGYSKDELIGNTHSIVNSGVHDKIYWSKLWKTIRSGEVWQGEICNKRKDGTFYWVDSVIAPVLDAKNKPIKYLAIRFDITKYKLDSASNKGKIKGNLINKQSKSELMNKNKVKF